MRRRDTFAWMSARAVRSTIRSWKEKRYSRAAPRAGFTNPPLISPRMVPRDRRRTRSTSRTLYDCILRRVAAITAWSPCGRPWRAARHASAPCAGRAVVADGARGFGLLEAGAQRFHEIDDFAAALRRDLRERRSPGLRLSSGWRPGCARAAHPCRRWDRTSRTFCCSMSCRASFSSAGFTSGFGTSISVGRAHVRGEVQLLHGEHIADRTQHHDVRLAARRPAADGARASIPSALR